MSKALVSGMLAIALLLAGCTSPQAGKPAGEKVAERVGAIVIAGNIAKHIGQCGIEGPEAATSAASDLLDGGAAHWQLFRVFKGGRLYAVSTARGWCEFLVLKYDGTILSYWRSGMNNAINITRFERKVASVVAREGGKPISFGDIPREIKEGIRAQLPGGGSSVAAAALRVFVALLPSGEVFILIAPAFNQLWWDFVLQCGEPAQAFELKPDGGGDSIGDRKLRGDKSMTLARKVVGLLLARNCIRGCNFRMIRKEGDMDKWIRENGAAWLVALFLFVVAVAVIATMVKFVMWLF